MIRGKVGCWAGFLVCTAVGAGAAHGAVLRDGGFEGVGAAPDDVNTASPAGTAGAWAGWNNWVAPYGAFYTNDVSHSGSQAGKTFSGPNGGLYQFIDVTGSGGAAFNASAWFLNRSSDAMNGAETADVRVTFFDGPNGTGNQVGQLISTPFTAASPADVWTQQSVVGAVPLGAASVQFMAFFNNPAGAGGAMYVDDASLAVDAVPEPGAMAMVALMGITGLSRRRRAK